MPPGLADARETYDQVLVEAHGVLAELKLHRRMSEARESILLAMLQVVILDTSSRGRPGWNSGLASKDEINATSRIMGDRPFLELTKALLLRCGVASAFAAKISILAVSAQ